MCALACQVRFVRSASLWVKQGPGRTKVCFLPVVFGCPSGAAAGCVGDVAVTEAGLGRTGLVTLGWPLAVLSTHNSVNMIYIYVEQNDITANYCSCVRSGSWTDCTDFGKCVKRTTPVKYKLLITSNVC